MRGEALGSGLTFDISKNGAIHKKLARSHAPACGRQGIRIAEFKTFEKKDFPGETFSVLKEKEEKQLGEYRTRRLVLEAWDKLNPG